mmetsp:Transcript_52234/g.113795  ORF Transcript_52234/g.113795 Transcript_52234/m.113795 type:complete len:207 (-) Transcript_52234:503-1123(-)
MIANIALTTPAIAKRMPITKNIVGIAFDIALPKELKNPDAAFDWEPPPPPALPARVTAMSSSPPLVAPAGKMEICCTLGAVADVKTGLYAVPLLAETLSRMDSRLTVTSLLVPCSKASTTSSALRFPVGSFAEFFTSTSKKKSTASLADVGSGCCIALREAASSKPPFARAFSKAFAASMARASLSWASKDESCCTNSRRLGRSAI